MRKSVSSAAIALLGLALSGCGGGKSSSDDLAGYVGGGESPATNGVNPHRMESRPAQRAQGTAAEEGIDCNSLPRGEAPDIVGVSIGMSADEAYRVIACANQNLRVSYSDATVFRGPDLPPGERPRTSIEAEGPREKIIATLIAMKGEERVVVMRRELTFGDGQQPQRDALLAELRGKYGAFIENPIFRPGFQGGAIRLVGGGTPGSSQDMNYFNCMPPIHEGPTLAERCELSVGAHIDRADNPGLARKMIVVMSKGAYGMGLLRAYRDKVSAALQSRQQRELDQAAGETPTL